MESFHHAYLVTGAPGLEPGRLDRQKVSVPKRDRLPVSLLLCDVLSGRGLVSGPLSDPMSTKF